MPFQDVLLNMKIRSRLLLGFGIMTVILAVMVLFTWTQVRQVGEGTREIDEVRVPLAVTSAQLGNSVTASLASLRGWLLTGKEDFKTDRLGDWARIEAARDKIDGLSTIWDDAARGEWEDFKTVLAEFQSAQDRVEAIGNTAEQFPANKLLDTEAFPLNRKMLQTISQIIGEEAGLVPTPERRRLFSAMGDIRSGLAVSEGNVRAFLLTGKAQYSNQFNGVWPWVKGRVKALQKNEALLNEAQKKALAQFLGAMQQFDTLAGRMIDIRKSDQWNVAQFLVVTEILPRVDTLLTFLEGAKGEDGQRAGGRVAAVLDDLSAQADAMAADLTGLEQGLWLLLVVGVLMGFGVVIVMSRSISDPIAEMTETMIDLAEGNQKVQVPALGQKDEIGAMATAVEVFKVNAVARDKAEAAAAEARRESEERAGKRADLSAGFDQDVTGVLAQVTNAAAEMTSQAEAMQGQAQSTDGLSRQVANASVEAANNVQTVAAAAEELAASVQEIRRQVDDSTRIASEAVTQAETTNSEIQQLTTAADRIGEAVNLITEIAEKTNLLALNATIEAARAGEAGKGFAVVANEVKNLANQTARATDEIGAQVGAIQAATGAAVAAIQGIGDTIQRMNEISAGISEAVSEQGSATQEIAKSTEQAATGTREVSSKIDEVQQASSATGAVAGEVLDGASTLSRQAEELKERVEGFLSDMRAV